MRKALTLTLCVGLALAIAGCATGGGMSPEEAITGQLAKVKSGLETKNIDLFMELVSEEFNHYEYGSKENFKNFVSQAMSMGDLNNAEVTLDDVEIVVTDDTAEAYPVELVAAFGSATMNLQFKKEADGAWRIVGMEMEGV